MLNQFYRSKVSSEKIDELLALRTNLKREIEQKIDNTKTKKEIVNEKRIRKSLLESKNLISKKNYTQSIEKLKKTKEMLNDITKSSIRRPLEYEINSLTDKTYYQLLSDDIEKGIALIKNDDHKKAREIFKKVVSKTVHMKETMKKDPLREKAKKMYDKSLHTYFSEELKSVLKLKEDSDYKKALSKCEKILKKSRNLYNSDQRNQLQKKVRRIIRNIRITKIKETILSLGANYSRLEIREIAEECGESKDLITTTIKEMIEGKEIYAKYFQSSNAVSFNQQKILENIEKLKEFINPAVIPEGPKICVVCRGKINYLLYECPSCKALYHLKCAKAIKGQGKGCFNCHTSFPPLPDTPTVKDDPVVLSVKSISEKLSSYLTPNELKHKDLSTHFQSLKTQLKEELTHKLSREFYEGFGGRIDDLFERFMVLDGSKVDQIQKLRSEQAKMFKQIQEKMEEFITSKRVDYAQEKIICPHCGETILKEEDQQICEFCGGSLEK